MTMHAWGRAELTEQYTKLSGKMMKHYERCHICYVDGVERRNATCKDMKDYLSKLAKIREQLDRE